MERIEAGPEVAAGEPSTDKHSAPPSTVATPIHAIGPGSLADLFESLLVTILIALFITTFVVQAYKIPSESMEPTLLVGDHLLVNKFVFEGSGAWYEKFLPYRAIRHGDVVIFKYAYDDDPDYVKRVIGLPGDRLRIIAGRVYINGKPLAEPYIAGEDIATDTSGENFPPLDPYTARTQLLPQWGEQIPNYIERDELVVPPDHYFVMGDNRDDSEDSRYWGFVSSKAVMGKPMFVYWSVEATSDDYEDRSILGTIESIAGTIIHLPSRTRWHRLFREVH